MERIDPSVFKYVLSDLDGVIRHFPVGRLRAAEMRNGLPEGAVLQTAFEKELLHKAICGAITDEAWRREVLKNLAKKFGAKAATAVVEDWQCFSGQVDERYLEYLESVFLSVPVVVLTNGTTRLRQDLTTLKLEKRFLEVVNSADLGFCKPDKRIFKHVLELLGCKAFEILFIDDSITHVQSAREIGMTGHHYISLDGLKEALITEEPKLT